MQLYQYTICSVESCPQFQPTESFVGLPSWALDADAILRSEEPIETNWLNFSWRISEYHCPPAPQSRFNAVDFWHSPRMHLKPLGISQSSKYRTLCIGSWLPSESVFNLERNGVVPMMIHRAPSACLFHGLSNFQSLCFTGGVLGWGFWAFEKFCCLAQRLLWHGSWGLFTNNWKSECGIYKCQTSAGVAKKESCLCVQSANLPHPQHSDPQYIL